MKSALRNVYSLSRFINWIFTFALLCNKHPISQHTVVSSHPQNEIVALIILEFDILTQNNVTMIVIF